MFLNRIKPERNGIKILKKNIHRDAGEFDSQDFFLLMWNKNTWNFLVE